MDAKTTSEGLVAFPDGIFSVNGVKPITLIFNFNLETAYRIPITAAAPPMSPRINPIPAPPLSEIPPVSNVIPFPAKIIGFSDLSVP